MDRTQTIIHAISKRGYTSYLELGCRKNDTFNAIRCARKVGVDSVSGGNVRMTTDEFFAQNKDTFDIVFIDANHHHDQVWKDFQNSLKVLNSGGVIVMHDCNPATEGLEAQHCCGTAWRTFTRHIRTNPDLDSIVGNYDHGVGIVRVAPNSKLGTLTTEMDDLTYDVLAKDRIDLLQLRNWDQIKEWL